MKKTILSILAIFFLSLLLLSAPKISQSEILSLPVSGEIGAKYITINQSKGLARLTEFSTLPNELSLSRLKLNHSCQMGVLHFYGKNLGEDDMKAELTAGFKNYISYDSLFVKTPHLLAPANLLANVLDPSRVLETDRTKEFHQLTLFPGIIGKSNVKLFYLNEDKKGKLSSDVLTGQRSRDKGVSAETTLGNLSGGLSYTTSEFQANVSGHTVDTISAYVQSNVGAENFTSLKYTNASIDPDATTNPAKEIQKDELNFETSLNFLSNFILDFSLLTKKVDNSTKDTISTDDTAYAVNLGYDSGDSYGGIEYSKSSKDYTGASITTKDTESFTLTGDRAFSWLVAKSKFSHIRRDTSAGAGITSLLNFEELSNVEEEKSVSISTKGLKQLGGTVFYKLNTKKIKPIGDYGMTSHKNRVKGLSAYIISSPKLTLSTNLAAQETAGLGRLFYSTDRSAGIYENSKSFNVGADYSLSNTLSLNIDFSSVRSNINDLVQSNKVKEQTLEIGFTKDITSMYSLNGTYTYNTYRDGIDTASNGRSNIYEIEMVGKF